jgi:hypothetical protein
MLGPIFALFIFVVIKLGAFILLFMESKKLIRLFHEGE